MASELELLLDSVKRCGHRAVTLKSSQGAAVLVLDYGARILGMFPNGEENLLWANPILLEPEGARNFFQTAGWRNTGGGRTWISPERDIHVRDLDDPWNSYTVPESVDPGRFTLIEANEQITLDTNGVVIHHRTGLSCGVHLRKKIQLAANPIQYSLTDQWAVNDVQYVGLDQLTTLAYDVKFTDALPNLSLWDAVNLPATGHILIPTVGKVRPTDFFEPTGSSHLVSSPAGLSFRFDGKERHKIALRVTDLAYGRAGYVRQLAEDQFTLVVRNFAIDPSAKYIDSPWNAPNDRGYVLQCYNDGGANGTYGELEYHSPAMGPGTHRSQCVDHAQLWGYKGARVPIFAIMSHLLGELLVEELMW